MDIANHLYDMNTKWKSQADVILQNAKDNIVIIWKDAEHFGA